MYIYCQHLQTPTSPSPAMVPSWHQVAKQYFLNTGWRACHRLFDMVWVPTENHWCKNHFYSTGRWEPRGISSLQDEHTSHTKTWYSCLYGLIGFICMQNRVVDWCLSKVVSWEIFSWNVWFQKLDFMHQLFSFFTKMQCLLEWGTVFIHYSGARKFWLFLELLQNPSKTRKRKMVQHKFS